MLKLFKNIFDLLSSFGLAVVLILLMLLLTFLGTLEQTEHGIFEVQKKYFESAFLLHDLGPLRIPLPGAYLVMSLFFLNLVLGGVVRIRKNWRKPGIIIAHLGILMMLLGGFVTFKFSERGNMLLYAEDQADDFYSAYDWVMEVSNPGESDEMLVVDYREFRDLSATTSRTFHSDELPFDLILSQYSINCQPLPVGPIIADQVRGVDGFFLEDLRPEQQAERNAPGCYVAAVDKTTGETTEGLLWAYANGPLTITNGGSDWTVKLARKRWPVPFVIKLDEFKRELYPGTQIPKSFESHVTKLQDGTEEKVRIYMNHPLRHEGYTFFQTSWGPSNALPGDPLYTVLEVVRNPSDQWPLYSCIIIGIGLSIHFLQKLVRYLQLESKRRSA